MLSNILSLALFSSTLFVFIGFVTLPAEAVFRQQYQGNNTYTTDSLGPKAVILPVPGQNVDAVLQLGTDATNPIRFTNTNNTGTLDINAPTQVNINAPLQINGALNIQGATLMLDAQNRLQVNREITGLVNATAPTSAVSLQQMTNAINAAAMGGGVGQPQFLSGVGFTLTQAAAQIIIDTTNLGVNSFPLSNIADSGIAVTEIELANFDPPVVFRILPGNATHMVRAGADNANATNIVNSNVGAPNFKTLPGTNANLEYDLQAQGNGQYIIILRRRPVPAPQFPFNLDVELQAEFRG